MCLLSHVSQSVLQTAVFRLSTSLAGQVESWVSKISCSTRHIIDHFGNESFQAINCTGTDNQKQRNKITHTELQHLGLDAFYNRWPGSRVGLFLQPWAHIGWATITHTTCQKSASPKTSECIHGSQASPLLSENDSRVYFHWLLLVLLDVSYSGALQILCWPSKASLSQAVVVTTKVTGCGWHWGPEHSFSMQCRLRQPYWNSAIHNT